jgi:TolB-like protein
MQASAHPAKLRFGGCVLDDGRGVLTAPGGAETALRPKTHELLRLLLQNAGRVVTRAEILDAVWPDIHVTDDSITQCVTEIRRALGEQGQGLLRTMPRRGYLLEAEVATEAARPPAAPTPQRDLPSIAVLPFRQHGSDPQDAYFADGIIEGIVHVLSGLAGVFVISQASTQALAAGPIDVRQVGRTFGVRYALHGGVRRAGDRLRIQTELSDAETGTIIRADRHEGLANDLFALQDRISVQVVAAIAPQVHAREVSRAQRKPPQSLTAYDLMLQGLDQFYRMERASFRRADDFFRAAIETDGDWAPPQAYLALLHMLQIGQGWTPDAAHDEAMAVLHADRGSALDPNDPLALAIKAHMRSFLAKDYADALRLLDRALAAGPNNAWAWSFGSATLGYIGRGPEAVTRAERAVALSPHGPFGYWHEHMLSQAHYVAGDYDAAVAWGRSAMGQNPRLTSNLRTLAAALVASGQVNEAASIGRVLLAVEPGFSVTAFARRTPLADPVRDVFVSRLREAGLPS